MKAELNQNPFAVQTPESIGADDVLSLFVEDFADYHQILRPGHTFLHGARGSGKSMIFRFLEPDCQALKHNCDTSKLEFFALYIPVKETELRITELLRLTERRHGSLTLNEHLMSVNFMAKAVEALKRAAVPNNETNSQALRAFISGPMTKLLRRGGWKQEVSTPGEVASVMDCLTAAGDVLEDVYAEVSQYIQRLSPAHETLYTGALFGFFDFVRPLLKALHELPFMPKGPIFLLIDDADNLNFEQTRILNTWVSSRGTAEISLKISTQRRYKTYQTTTGQAIETPHDFGEVEISDLYTSEKDRYLRRVRSIVEKRLLKANIVAKPEEFFPWDEAQEAKIRAIGDQLRSDWNESGRGHRARDDANRYARPDFIKGLLGSAKSGHTYSYAGFEQLVHVSSGVVRYFLEPATLMYGEQKAENKGAEVTAISPSIQDKVCRSEADKFLSAEFERITKDEKNKIGTNDRATKLRNLIDSLGALFRAILTSDDSERRVFSIAFSNGPDEEVREILKLGTDYNYFHTAMIGKKEGAGRTTRYVLSRRLAPVFNLDPTSFAGYKFITNDAARLMMLRPKTFQNQLRSYSPDQVVDSVQGTLFGEEGVE